MEVKLKIEPNEGKEDAPPVDKTPLLPNTPPSDTCTAEKTHVQKAISQTCHSTSHLLTLLPTGSVMTFQLLSPVFTNQGECDTVSQVFTIGLIALCGFSCFLLTFTDSFKDKKGTLCFGFVTPKGLWIIDGPGKLPPEHEERYRLGVIDFVHAFMSLLIFLAVVLMNQNAVYCFYPRPSGEAKELLTKLPLAIGVVCSIMFVVFPTHRHGIGCPFDHSQPTNPII